MESIFEAKLVKRTGLSGISSGEGPIFVKPCKDLSLDTIGSLTQLFHGGDSPTHSELYEFRANIV